MRLFKTIFKILAIAFILNSCSMSNKSFDLSNTSIADKDESKYILSYSEQFASNIQSLQGLYKVKVSSSNIVGGQEEFNLAIRYNSPDTLRAQVSTPGVSFNRLISILDVRGRNSILALIEEKEAILCNNDRYPLKQILLADITVSDFIGILTGSIKSSLDNAKIYRVSGSTTEFILESPLTEAKLNVTSKNGLVPVMETRFLISEDDEALVKADYFYKQDNKTQTLEIKKIVARVFGDDELIFEIQPKFTKVLTFLKEDSTLKSFPIDLKENGFKLFTCN